MENKLQIMIDSLDKKISVLQKIQTYNEKQEKSFSEGEPDLDSFDEAISEKDQLIEELLRLDNGFDLLFGEVRAVLEKDRSQYTAQIVRMQEQIRQITDLSNAVQAKEARNKKLIEEYFQRSRAGLRQGRQQSKAALDYYKNMSGAGAGLQHAGLWDSKQ